MNKRWLRWAIPVAVLVVAGAAWALIGDDVDAGSTARVTREDLALSVEASGKLEAAVAFEIGPPSVRDFWQYNLEWMIPEGTPVKEGDVVARFDATQLDDRLREHRANLEKVQQEKEKEQRNLELSLRELNLDLVKYQGELKKVDLDLGMPEGLVSMIEYRQSQLEKELAERQVAFLEEKIEFEQARVASMLELLDVKRAYEEGKIGYYETIKEKFNVKAPVAGLVVYIAKPNGDRWEVGEGVWMLAKILEIADVTTLQIEASVLEMDAARIALGQSAQVSVDAIPGLSIDSEISEIGELVRERSQQDRSKVFDAVLPLGDTDREQLKPGMGVKVTIETGRIDGSLTIPIEAVLTADRGTFVEVVGSGGSVERRAVELGSQSRDRVVVLSGVEEDEVVRLVSGGQA